MKNLVSTAMLAVGLLASQGANAKVFAECGAFKGYAYYYPGPLMKKKDTGFGEDGIKKQALSGQEIQKPQVLVLCYNSFWRPKA